LPWQSAALRRLDGARQLEAYAGMTAIGDPIHIEGTLVREGAGFALRVAGGRHYELQLPRVPVDLFEKRVLVTGTLIGDWLIEAEGVAPA